MRAIVFKTRGGVTLEERRGKLIYGEKPERRVREGKVWYAIDLMMNQDASLYLDTRRLREWAYRNLEGKRVLNTFAYTGSLGIAAHAGGATQVLHLDINRKYLNIAKDSYPLNGFPIRKSDFIPEDFWTYTSRMRRNGERFDCVFLDPPYFSQTSKGRLDLNQDTSRLINKLRPLVNSGGNLVAINNALYVSGTEYIRSLETLAADGYLEITELIPVPEDITGYPQTIQRQAPVSPAPFNHSTKIAILTVR
jgi:23S rRNA (cytosine1962-C5)-methyltransferase